MFSHQSHQRGLKPWRGRDQGSCLNTTAINDLKHWNSAQKWSILSLIIHKGIFLHVFLSALKFSIIACFWCCLSEFPASWQILMSGDKVFCVTLFLLGVQMLFITGKRQYFSQMNRYHCQKGDKNHWKEIYDVKQSHPTRRFCQYQCIFKIWSKSTSPSSGYWMEHYGSKILTSIKGHNSVMRFQKLRFNNLKLDLVNINANAKYGQILWHFGVIKGGGQEKPDWTAWPHPSDNVHVTELNIGCTL